MFNTMLEKNILKKCNACGKDVMTDKYGNGRCTHCGWAYDEDAPDFPDDVRYPNIVTLNSAIRLAKEGKELKPTIDEFIQGYEFYGEMEFYYRGHRYGIITLDQIKFYEWNVKGSVQSFNNMEEFKAKAHINGVLVKDIWDKVEDAYYIRG